MEIQTPEMGQTNSQDEGQSENQELYDIFVAQGIKLAQATAKRIQGNASIDTLGSALFDIVNKVESEGEKNGVKFGLDVLIHGSNEVLGHLLEMCKVDVQEEQIKAIVGTAVGKYLDNAIKTGKMTSEQVVQLAQQAKQSEPEGAGVPKEAPQRAPVTGGQGLLETQNG